MNTLIFNFNNTLIDSGALASLNKKLKAMIGKLALVRNATDYCTPEALINLPFDGDMHKEVKALVSLKKKLNPVCIIVIGIGGSNLGTQAIYNALFTKRPDCPLYFADTLDSEYIATLLELVEEILSSHNQVLMCVISKSGTTTETIANFECFLAVLLQYRPNNYSEYIIAITDQDSRLWQLATRQRFACLAIPAAIGGRYSVLSAVGLFPLACAGIDIDALVQGAQAVVADCIREDNKNYAAQSAAISAYHYDNGKTIHDFFTFNIWLEGIGKWYRQLVAESLAKEHTLDGKQAYRGITPTVSVATTDLHSVGQLYLGGPFDKLTTFVWVENTFKDVYIPSFAQYENLVGNIQGKSLNHLMRAIFYGVQKAYSDNNRPFITITFPEKTPYYLGQFLQYKMIEVIYLGALLEVNPFDQPHVELYKTQTKKILAYE